MSILLAVSAAFLGLVVLVVKALIVDEARGRVQRRVAASLEATIASLPIEIQEEWAEEWRGELAAAISMPWTAFAYVRNVRESAEQLVVAKALELVLTETARASARAEGWSRQSIESEQRRSRDLRTGRLRARNWALTYLIKHRDSLLVLACVVMIVAAGWTMLTFPSYVLGTVAMLVLLGGIAALWSRAYD